MKCRFPLRVYQHLKKKNAIILDDYNTFLVASIRPTMFISSFCWCDVTLSMWFYIIWIKCMVNLGVVCRLNWQEWVKYRNWLTNWLCSESFRFFNSVIWEFYFPWKKNWSMEREWFVVNWLYRFSSALSCII